MSKIDEIIELSDPEKFLTNKERMARMRKIWELARGIQHESARQPVSVSLETYTRLYCDSYYEYNILDRRGYKRQEFIDKFYERMKPMVKMFLEAAGVLYVD